MKITMLGISGSGKTTYMSGLYETFSIGTVSQFKIKPFSDKFDRAFEEEGKFQALSYEKNKYTFPPGTDRTTAWNFALTYQTREVVDFQWIDYRGGSIEELGQSPQEPNGESKELLTHISLSNGVLIFCDAISLANYANPKQAARRMGANRIIQVLENYSQHYPGNRLSVGLVITKADSDLLSDEWLRNDYSLLVSRAREIFRGVSELCRFNPTKWKGGIMVVGSVGTGCVKSQITMSDNLLVTPHQVSTIIVDDPVPFNCEVPLFFSIGNILGFMKERAQHEVQQFRRNAQEAFESSTFFREVWAAWQGTKSPAELAEDLCAKAMQSEASLAEFAPIILPLVNTCNEKVFKL